MRYYSWAVALLLPFAIAGPAAHSLPGSAALAGQDRPLFTSTSELVLLHVTVRDRDGAYVAGLTKDAFTIFDNNRAQSIRFFLDEDAPVTVGLLVDDSGSTQPNRALVVAAASSFVETSNPRDEVFALAFNDDVQRVLPSTQPFTDDADTLGRSLTRTMAARGRTALYDAIVEGLKYADAGTHTRKVLVVVSDGVDNVSEATLDDVVARLQSSNTVLYAVGLVDPLDPDQNESRLRKLTAMTGGETFLPRDASQVKAALERIARDIRHTYVVAYEPPDSGTRDPLHHIRVVVRDPRHGGLRVRTRAGYLDADRP